MFGREEEAMAYQFIMPLLLEHYFLITQEYLKPIHFYYSEEHQMYLSKRSL